MNAKKELKEESLTESSRKTKETQGNPEIIIASKVS